MDLPLIGTGARHAGIGAAAAEAPDSENGRYTFTPSADPKVLSHFRKRLDDFLAILEQHLQKNAFATGERVTIADFSMMAYLHYPADETGYDFATSHPAIAAWLGRIADLPGWKSAYDLLPGQRLKHYV